MSGYFFSWLILKQIRVDSTNMQGTHNIIRICWSTLPVTFRTFSMKHPEGLELPFQVPEQFFFPRFILLGKRIVRVKVGMSQTYLVCLLLSVLFPLFHIIRIFGLTSCTSPAKQLKLGCTPKLTNQHLDNPDNNLLVPVRNKAYLQSLYRRDNKLSALLPALAKNAAGKF